MITNIFLTEQSPKTVISDVKKIVQNI